MTDLIYPSSKPNDMLAKHDIEYKDVWRHRAVVLSSYYNMLQQAENMMASALNNNSCRDAVAKQFYRSLSCCIMLLNGSMPSDELIAAGEAISKSTLNLSLSNVFKIYDILQSCDAYVRYLSSAVNEYDIVLSDKFSVQQLIGCNQFVYDQLLDILSILRMHNSLNTDMV